MTALATIPASAVGCRPRVWPVLLMVVRHRREEPDQLPPASAVPLEVPDGVGERLLWEPLARIYHEHGPGWCLVCGVPDCPIARWAWSMLADLLGGRWTW